MNRKVYKTPEEKIDAMCQAIMGDGGNRFEVT